MKSAYTYYFIIIYVSIVLRVRIKHNYTEILYLHKLNTFDCRHAHIS